MSTTITHKSTRIEIPFGTKFGNWTVIGNPLIKGKTLHWQCKCTCGNEYNVSGYSLRKGLTSQCQTCKLENIVKNPTIRLKKEHTLQKKWGNSAAVNELIASYIRNAKKRNYNFDLTKEQFFALTSQNCHYCNKPPSSIKWTPNRKHGFIRYNGIDRKNNMIGYVSDNCVPCCIICNKAKLTMSYEEFKEWIQSVTIHFGGL